MTLLLIAIIAFHHISITVSENFSISYPRITSEIDLAKESNTEINITLIVDEISPDRNEMFLNAKLRICLEWFDDRFEADGKNPSTFSSLWKPKIYFRNGVASSTIFSINPVQFLRVNLIGTKKRFRFCQNLFVRFYCHFRMENFPFDRQICIESSERLNLRIIQFDILSSSQKFFFEKLTNGQCEILLVNEFEQRNCSHPCVSGRFKLIRNFRYYLLRYYAPTILLVLTDFVQFWTPTICGPGRALFTGGLEIALKTISNIAYGETESRHIVPLFLWLWACQFFIYMSEIEFAAAFAWMHFVNDKKYSKSHNHASPDGHYFGKNNWFKQTGTIIDCLLQKIFGPINFFDDPINRNKVDYTARILFPIFFIFFIVLYSLMATLYWIR
ncbi:glutamate-gated chloride channel-like protein 3 [Sarcoptes scabiei]|uniref:Glutamate-gated chloride channel-like protein 3 n=1 Tax=Sarcoptes scabiei TaxID=52283 RepID=A0A132AM75_SARSC|nr:glutamate-gated chloride channel-like protein 3 [Sarcoptes scabiei]